MGWSKGRARVSGQQSLRRIGERTGQKTAPPAIAGGRVQGHAFVEAADVRLE